VPKDPDIKSSSKPSKEVKQTASKKPAKAATGTKPKQLSFKDKLNKFGIKREHNKKTIITVGVSALVALFVTISVFGVAIYKYKSSNRAVKIASAIVPYPVSSVNGNWFWNTLTYNQYLFELASIQKFYTSQGQDLSSQEGKQKLSQLKNDIIIQLENNLIIEQQARKYGIKVSSKEIQTQYDDLVKNAGGVEKVKTTLDKLYGWTIDDFKEKIKQSVLQKKLAEKILADESLNAPAKKQIEDIKKQIDGGADFAELAKKFSADGSASNGGDLGLISKGQTVPEFEAAAFGLQPGQVSGVVKTQYGYHILKVTGKEGDQVRVSHILIKGADLESWLKDQRAKAKIVQYFKP
jgi:parvulin-like peptidyl-prolyl isomerase